MRRAPAGQPVAASHMPVAAAAPVPLNTDISVAHRPVTQQGLSGMTTAKLGPRRQIADKSFFITTLRGKFSAIAAEIQKMKEEIEQRQRDSQLVEKLERKYETRVRDVRHLEGNLADFNLALDKVRTHTNVAQIRSMHDRLKQQNEYERAQVDSVFIRGSTHDKARDAALERIREIHNSAAERIKALGEAEFQDFAELQRETAALEEASRVKRDRVLAMEREIATRRAELQSPAFVMRARAVQLAKRREQLLHRHQALGEEVNSPLSPEELKQKLLDTVKRKNGASEAMAKQVKENEQKCDELNAAIQSKEALLVEAKRHAQKAQKYEAVYARERKMQEFVDAFPAALESELGTKRKLQSTIVALLKHMSKSIAVSSDPAKMPSRARLEELKDEVSFKSMKMENSQQTLSILRKDLEERRVELEKVSKLNKKISAELRSLHEKMRTMRESEASFKGEEDVRKDAAQRKKELIRLKNQGKKLQGGLQLQVSLKAALVERQQRELESNTVVKRLHALEKQLLAYSQTRTELEDFVAARKRETDFGPRRAEVVSLVADINSMLLAR